MKLPWYHIAPRHHSPQKLWAQYILLGLPTILLVAYVLWLANQYFALLQNHGALQTAAFAGGLLLAFTVFAHRFRFITLTAIMLVAAWLVYQLISSRLVGEFDAFFWSVRFNTLAFLFMTGWITGYGFSRARFYSVLWSVVMLAAMVVVVSKVSPLKADTIILGFAPILAYAFYIIYTSEFIRNISDDDPRLWGTIGRRLLGFGVLMALLILGLLAFFKPSFEVLEKEWAGASKPTEGNQPANSMTRNDGNGVTTQNNMGLQGFNNRANKDSVLFVAKLDNYFPDGKTPNPLYFTTDYFSKFDSETQSFEIDTARPYNDLFSPDVSQIALYFTRQDTSVLSKAMSSKNRRVATAEVYKHNLSPRLYTAPSTAYFVQPIAVPDENKDIYKSAYRAKMMVSELNSAYFVYNPVGDELLKQFQEQRFEVLRKAPDYSKMPADFMQYYTYMPSGNDYDSIRTLANEIVNRANAKTTVDKVIALRDYFTALDEDGQPTFKYSDNPGIPGLPSANKLTYFLFQNKKGYCAYFAGATLFLLRGLGIPSRVVTGFLTVDRSSKNPGWYWFYEDQAHAWVQVYFPEYGWIDFDTTVPDAEQQQAPQPDQTPPLASQTVWLVANGKAIAVDTAAKRVRMQLEKMLYWDQPYAPAKPTPLEMDVSLAKITRDSGQVPLHELKPGENIVAVSYAQAFKELPPKEQDSALSLLARFPNPAPIDEIKIMLEEEQQKDANAKTSTPQPVNWKQTFWITALVLLAIILLLLSLPWLVYRYLHYRATHAKDLRRQAYWQYLASLFYANQLGISAFGQPAPQFARHTLDAVYGTNALPFMQVYQKIKYSRQPLLPAEESTIRQYYPAVVKQLAAQIPPGIRVRRFLQPLRTLQFFTTPKKQA